MSFNPWALFRSQRSLWLTLAVSLGLLLIIVLITASLFWTREHLTAEQSHSFTTYLIIVAVSTEAIVIAIVLWATTSVTRPMREAVQVLDRVAAGDLTARLDTLHRDELGKMAGALNVTTASLAVALRKVGEGATTLAASASAIGEVSDRLATSAQSTSRQADVVATAAISVSTATQSTATGIKDMSVAIEQIATTVDEATRIARDAVLAAAATNAIIARLGGWSAEIADVVNVITAIAAQTNLLALNATIEAARAGDAGRGFAVVAGEVKELAQETAGATDDITRRISAMRADTASAVDAVAGIGSIVGRIDQLQATIAAAVRQQSSSAAGINANTSGTAAQTAEISTGIAAVSGSAQETSKAVHAVRDSANDLGGLAGRLAALVGQYRTER